MKQLHRGDEIKFYHDARHSYVLRGMVVEAKGADYVVRSGGKLCHVLACREVGYDESWDAFLASQRRGK